MVTAEEVGAANEKIEKLDCIYICKQCKANFLFMSDLADHAAMTGHAKDFVHIRIEEWDGGVSNG